MEAVARVAGVVGWQARSYRRLWFGTATTSFLNPIFFLVSIGVVALGEIVDKTPIATALLAARHSAHAARCPARIIRDLRAISPIRSRRSSASDEALRSR